MNNILEQQIISCFYKKERFRLRDIIMFKKGKLHIHRFIPNDVDKLSAKFEARCKKCGYIMSHNW